MRLLTALALLVVSAISPAQGRFPEDLQPYTRSSLDARWTISVDPKQRDGYGGATYRVAQAGEAVWSAEKPWTLRDAVITDLGFVAGHAVAKDASIPSSMGTFHAVILAPDGSVKLDEQHARGRSKQMHGSPWPWGNGVFEQPDLGRVVFRVAQPAGEPGHEEWWCFELPSAKEVFRKRPGDTFEHGDAVLGARGVRGTPLTLVQWREYDYPNVGFRLALHDADLRAVWTSEPLEVLNGADDAQDRTIQELWKGTLLDEKAERTFAVGLLGKQERVRFEVERAGDGWAVREIAREPWSSATPAPTRLVKYEDMAVTELESRGTFALEGAPVQQWALHDILAFDFLPGGGFRVVRDEVGATDTLLRVDGQGLALHERSAVLADALADPRPRHWPIGAKTWLATQSPHGEGARALAWRIDEETGVATPLREFDSPSVDAVAALGEGRFVVLATSRGEYSSHDVLAAFDAEGRTLWRIEGDSGSQDPGSLFSAEALCVTTDGVVVVVDVIRHTLQFFDAEGKFQRVLELDDAWGRKANYPSGVTADLDGGVLVHDFNGEPPIYRMRKDDSVLAKLTPRFPSGKLDAGLTRHARVAPDGRVWATDGQRLLRLDENGVVDLEVGARLDPDVLSEPSAGAIDMHGRALIQDRATAAVHVFDGKGKRLFVCRPDPTDFKNPNSLACLTSTRDRGVLAQVNTSAKFIRFGPDGARLGEFQLPDRTGWFAPSPVADGGYASWPYSSKGIVQVGERGERLASFERAPDGSWLRNAARVCVAPDGVPVVAARAGAGELDDVRALIRFDDADPSKLRAIHLPPGTPSSYVAAGRTWYAMWSFHAEGLLVSKSGEDIRRFRAPESGEDRFCPMGFDPETDELVVLDPQKRRILRFALPRAQ